MKKIAVFVDRWMSGGIESYLTSSYEQMNLFDLEITILTTKKLSPLYDDRLKNIGIKIIELLPDKKTSEITRTLKSQEAFKKVILKEEFDIVHLNIYNGVSLVYAKLAQECGVKRVIAHSHNSAIGHVRLKRLKIIAHKFGKIRYENYVTDFWACSDLAGEWLFSSKKRNKIKLMRNGIDTNKFQFDIQKRELFRKKYNILTDKLVLGNIGRLNNQKNQLFIVDLAKELSQRKIPFTILIAGEGELEQTIQNKIKELKLENSIFLIGTIVDTPSFYSGIDIFLLPSLFEGNPIAGIEAQCSGVKCLFSDNITKQVKVTDSSYFLNLNAFKKWMKYIQINEVELNQRKFSYKIVKKAHFDISDTSKEMRVELLDY